MSVRFFRNLCLRFFFTFAKLCVFYFFSLTCLLSFSILSFYLLVVQLFDLLLTLQVVLPWSYQLICFFFCDFIEIAGGHLNLFQIYCLGWFPKCLSYLWVFVLILKVFDFLWFLALLTLLICDHFLCRPLWSLRNLSLFLFDYSNVKSVWFLVSPLGDSQIQYLFF